MLLKKLSEVRKLTTFYLSKKDHRWVTFIFLKTINSDLQREVATDGVFRGAHGDRSAEKADR